MADNPQQSSAQSSNDVVLRCLQEIAADCPWSKWAGLAREALTAYTARRAVETKPTLGQEPWRVSLPVITIQMLADYGQEGFFEKTDRPVQGVAGVSWSQAAVDFACMLQGLRQVKAGEAPRRCSWTDNGSPCIYVDGHTAPHVSEARAAEKASAGRCGHVGVGGEMLTFANCTLPHR